MSPRCILSVTCKDESRSSLMTWLILRVRSRLRPEHYIDDSRRGRALDRFRLFADSYGLTDSDRDDLVTAVRLNHEWSYAIVGTAAAHGHVGFTDYWFGGAMQRATDTWAWYGNNSDGLQAALTRR